MQGHKDNMAKIEFTLSNTEAAAINLSAAVGKDVKSDAHELSVVFEEVKEELAMWLFTSLVAYHGLLPSSFPFGKPDRPAISEPGPELKPVPLPAGKRAKPV